MSGHRDLCNHAICPSRVPHRTLARLVTDGRSPTPGNNGPRLMRIRPPSGGRSHAKTQPRVSSKPPPRTKNRIQPCALYGPNGRVVSGLDIERTANRPLHEVNRTHLITTLAFGSAEGHLLLSAGDDLAMTDALGFMVQCVTFRGAVAMLSAPLEGVAGSWR